MLKQVSLVTSRQSSKQARKYFAPLGRNFILRRHEVFSSVRLVGGKMDPEKTFSETPCTIASFSSENDRDSKGNDIDQLISDAKKKGILLPHEQQHFNWDCGITCLRMVLKYFDKNRNGELIQQFSKMRLRTSVWTIDLAYLLTAFEIKNQLSTITLGVDANYADVDFYATHLSRDNLRVNQLFRDAHLKGVKVVKESVSMDDIVDFLDKRQPIIILIDWKKMSCIHCCTGPRLSKKLKDSMMEVFNGSLDSETDNKTNRGYQGHYVCLTGVDREKRLIYFSNPSAKHPVCVSSVEEVETARKSYGTDEDLIFIFDTLKTE